MYSIKNDPFWQNIRPQQKFYALIKVWEETSTTWFAATYVLYLLSAGLTLAQTALVNTVYMATGFVIDPLGGWLGDKLGLLKVYLLGLTFLGVSTVLYSIPFGLSWFMLCEALSAIGAGLMSNMIESWLVNSTSKAIASETKGKVKGLLALTSIFPRIIGSVIGNTFGFNIPFLLSGITCLLAIVVTAIWVKTHQIQDVHVAKHAKSADTVVAPKPVKKELVKLAVTLFILAAGLQAVNMYWSPRLKEISGTGWWLGLFSVMYGLCIGFGPTIVSKITVPSKWQLMIILAGISGSLFVTAISQNLWVIIVFFLLHEVGRGIFSQLVDTYMNLIIHDHNRGFATSLVSAAAKAGNGFGLLALTVTASSGNISFLWIVSSVIVAVAAISLITLKD